jgi:maleylpyruvate isomerase
MPELVTLHGYFRSSAAFRVRIGLNLKRISYQTIPHHLRRGEQRSEDYLMLNPQGLVPTLKIDGIALTQSLAILDYLEETRPTPALLPKAPASRARVRALAQIIACDIHPIDNLRVLSYLRGELAQDEAHVGAWYNHWVALGFEALEGRLVNSSDTGDFCHGSHPTLADICLVPQVMNARNFKLDMSPYPHLAAIAARAMALPAFAAAMPDRQVDAE